MWKCPRTQPGGTPLAFAYSYTTKIYYTFFFLALSFLLTWQWRQGPVVVYILEEGHVHRLPSFGKTFPPLCRVADVLLDQIISPGDGEGHVVVSRHV